MKKKIPLSDKIKYRMTQNWKDFDLNKTLKSFFNTRKTENEEKGFFCLYNHLTPNRNLTGFDYATAGSTNMVKINEYYKKISEIDNISNFMNINENNLI